MKKELVLLLILLVLGVFASHFSYAFTGTPGIDVKQTHPRIWLDDEVIARLMENKNLNTPAWSEILGLAQECNANGPTARNGGLQLCPIYLALAYKATGDTRYAEKARYMIVDPDMLNMFSSGLATSNFGYHVDCYASPIVFDWLYDYLLTTYGQAEIDKWVTTFRKWNEYVTNYRNIYWTDTDYFISTPKCVGLASIAAYYEDLPYSKKYLDWTLNILFGRRGQDSIFGRNLFTLFINKWHRGGVYPEGTSYGGSMNEHLFYMRNNFISSLGIDIFANTSFASEILQAGIYYTAPNGKAPSYGDIQNPREDIGSYGWGSVAYSSSAVHNSTLEGYANQMFGSGASGLAGLLFFKKAPAIDYKQELAKEYFAPGTGFLFSRGSWDSDATYLAFQCKGGGEVEHCQDDSLNFQIMRKGVWLVKEIESYCKGVGNPPWQNTFHNTLVLTKDKKQYGTQWPWDYGSYLKLANTSKYDSQLEHFEYNNNYMYASCDATANYNSKKSDYWSTTTNVIYTNKVVRNIIYVKPDIFIIYDYANASRNFSVPPKLFYLHLWNEPEVEDNSFVMEYKGQKLFGKSLLTSSVMTKVNETQFYEGYRVVHNCADVDEQAANQKKWHIKINDTSSGYETQFLNVLYASDASVTEAPQSSLITASENAVGVYIDSPKKIIIFSRVPLDKQELYSYQSDYTGTANHLITELKQGTYKVYRNDILIETKTTSKDSTITFESNSGSFRIERQSEITCESQGGTCLAYPCYTYYDRCSVNLGECPVNKYCCLGNCLPKAYNPYDKDNDTYTWLLGKDCNDANSAILPGAKDIQCNGIDEDCNGYDLCPQPNSLLLHYGFDDNVTTPKYAFFGDSKSHVLCGTIAYSFGDYRLGQLYITKDSSQSKLNGTYNQAILIPGIKNMAAWFNNPLTRIDSQANLGWTKSESFSIGFWMNPYSTANAYPGILGKTPDWYFLFKDGIIHFYYFNAQKAIEIDVKSSAKVPVKTWQHVLVTYNAGEKKARLYLDGVLASTDSNVQNEFLVTRNPVVLGISGGGTYQQFYGALDEFKIWNYALSGSEISNEIVPKSVCLDGDGDGFFSRDELTKAECLTPQLDCYDNTMRSEYANVLCKGTIDCSDPSYSTCAKCINPGAVEICDDKIDNNCNNFTDCQDSLCSATETCNPSPIIKITSPKAFVYYNNKISIYANTNVNASCSYSIDSSSFVEMQSIDEDKTSKKEFYALSDVLAYGLHTLTLSCDNSIGSRTSTSNIQFTLSEGGDTGKYYTINAEPVAHDDYGFLYPMTYQFLLPSNSENLAAYKKYGDEWILLDEKNSSDFYNAVELVRFDYANRKAYVSAAFSPSSEQLSIKIQNQQGKNVGLYAGTSKYYDNRKMAFVLTADDWNYGDAPNDVLYHRTRDYYFRQYADILREAKIWMSVGIQAEMSQKVWNSVQEKLDLGYIEAGSHSYGHDPLNTSKPQMSKELMMLNLTFPRLYNNGNKEYLYSWIEPYGQSSKQMLRALSRQKFLVSRSTAGHWFSYADWDEEISLFKRVGYSMEYPGNENDAKSIFSGLRTDGGVMLMYGHPPGYPGVQPDCMEPGATMRNIIDYVKGKPDVWYVGLGALYLYRYMATRNVLDVSYEGDPNAPQVSITHPQNSVYAHPVTELKYHVIGNNLEKCWYSGNGGVTESQPVSAGINFTLTSYEGNNNWIVFCNNSLGSVGIDLVSFSIDSGVTPPTTCTDADNDGYNSTAGICGLRDCNDNSASINPSAAEICRDELDNDCDSQTDEACPTEFPEILAHYPFHLNFNDNLTDYVSTPIGNPELGAGKIDNALNLSGSNYINTGRDFSWSSNQGFAVAFWLNTKNASQLQGIIGKANSIGTDSNWEWSIFLTYRTIKFVYYNTGANVGVQVSSPAITSNSWNHVVVSYNNLTKKAKIYLNGNLVATSSAVTSSFYNRANSMKIGLAYTGTSASKTFNGLIDDVRIYNGFLTVREADSLYNMICNENWQCSEWSSCTDNQQTRTCEDVNACGTQENMPEESRECSVGENGLLAYYKFEGDVLDSSGNNNHATNSGSQASSGKLGKSLSFDGNDYVRVGLQSQVFNKITISAWIYKSSNAGQENYRNIFSKGFWQSSQGKGIFMDFGDFAYEQIKCGFSFEDGTPTGQLRDIWIPTGSVPRGKWVKVVCIFNGTDMLGFVNGKLLRKASETSSLKQNSLPIMIGASSDGATIDNNWIGKIDDVKIYNISLSEEQVKQDYENDILSGWWKFDLNENGKTRDYSIFSNNASLILSSLSPGLLGNSLSSGYADAGNSSILMPADEFSLSLWVNPEQIDYSDSPQGAGIIGKLDNNGYFIGINNNNKLVFATKKENTEYKAEVDSDKLNVGEWNHLALVFASDYIKAYINGEYVMDNQALTGLSLSNLTIGKLFGWDNFNGMIDEVRIFNKALSTKEIQAELGRISCSDSDNDDYNDEKCGGNDCSDASNLINPGASEIECNGIDEDCNGYDLCSSQQVVTLKVHKYSPTESAAENLVSQAVPLKKGALYDINNVKVKDNGVEIPIYAKALANWTDNSIKSIFIQFNADFGTETKDYTLVLEPRTLDMEYIPVSVAFTGKIFTLSPEHLSYSKVLGEQTPVKSSNFMAWNNKLLNEFSDVSVVGTLPCAQKDNPYDAAHASYQTYARTGDLNYLITARKWAIHHGRDQIYLSGVNIGHGRCDNGIIEDDDWDQAGQENYVNVTRYSYPQGLADDYLLWGDEESLRVSGLIADNFFMNDKLSHYYIAPNTRGHFNERDAAFALLGLISHYQATNNPAYLDNFIEKFNLLYNMQEDNGGTAFVHNLYDHDTGEGQPVWRYGISPWMTGLLLEPIIIYHQLTGDEKARQSIIWALDYMLANNCLSNYRTFYYPDGQDIEIPLENGLRSMKYFCAPGSGGAGEPDLDNMISHAFAYGYRLTGNENYKEAALDLLNTSVIYGATSNTKHYIQQFRSSGLVESYIYSSEPEIITCTDNDEDGFNITAFGCGLADCNDDSSLIHPGAIEACNNIDDNCNSQTDESLTDSCGSGSCSGNKICAHGLWSSCSSSGLDAGVCSTCDADGELVYDATQNSDCNDNNICNGLEICQSAGVCLPGVSLDCASDGISCTLDSCNPISGCLHTPDNSLCSDSYSCTDDSCSLALGCTYTANDDNCESGEKCIGANGFNCIETVDSCLDMPDGTNCYDGDNCTITKTCLAGICQGGSPKDCSAFNLLGINSCTDASDSNAKTRDLRQAFTSSCLSLGDCSQANAEITHTCDLTCGAECLADNEVSCPASRCEGNDFASYPSNGRCSSCLIDNSSSSGCRPELIDDTRCFARKNLTISLKSGINFFSVPLLLENYNASRIFSGMPVEKIYSYDEEWKVFHPNKPELSSIQEFEPGKGYVLFAAAPFSISLEGHTKINSSNIISKPKFRLKRGWNLISPFSDKNSSELFSGLNYTKIFSFNKTSNQYLEISSSNMLEKDKSYWIYMNNEDDFNVK